MKIFKRKSKDISDLKIPEHIGFIMDGNGRWAKRRGLPRNIGHRAGVETLRRVIRFCGRSGVKVVTFYAFSTENWRRPTDEVQTLMRLFVEYFNSEIDELNREGARVRIIGDRDGVPADVLEAIRMAESRTRDNAGIVVNIAFNYGGRAEIVRAARRLAQRAADGEIAPGDIDEKMISDNLYTAGLPDPDLIVRTSAEYRISNFLLYQLAYAEFLFPKVLWPDVDEAALVEMFRAYSARDRRFGGVK